MSRSLRLTALERRLTHWFVCGGVGVAATGFGAVGCSNSNDGGESLANGGTRAQGGTTNRGGESGAGAHSGGAVGTGGIASVGGSSSVTGGQPSQGSSSSAPETTGGAASTGGAPAAGGTSEAIAGASAIGGTVATGSTSSAPAATGGTQSTGGAADTGGAANTAGASNYAGTPAIGGSQDGGGASSAPDATGGASSAPDATGGTPSIGGAAEAGGSADTGGTSNTASTSGTGGTAEMGGSSSAPDATGGTQATGGATDLGGTSNTSATGGATSCTPDCTNKECGSDGCTGSCGTCSAGICSSAGQCVECTEAATECTPGELAQGRTCTNGHWVTQACPTYSVCVTGACKSVCDGRLATESYPSVCYYPVNERGFNALYMSTNDATRLSNTLGGVVDGSSIEKPISVTTSGTSWPYSWTLMSIYDYAYAAFKLSNFTYPLTRASLYYRARRRYVYTNSTNVFAAVDNGSTIFASALLTAPSVWQVDSQYVSGSYAQQFNYSSGWNEFLLGTSPVLAGSTPDYIELSWYLVEIRQ